jgi:Tol biopolymer transport system component
MEPFMNRSSTRNCLVVAACALSANASASQLVYLAEQDVAFVPEVYLVDLDRPTESLKLNRALSSRSTGVLGITLSPDGTRMAFIADQDARGDFNLYLLDFAALGQWTRLGSLGAGALETFARFSPDGSRLAFTAVDQNFANSQLYLVELATPSVSVRLNPTLAVNGFVSTTGFEFTPDGRHIVYAAAQERSEVDLYLADLAAPGAAVRLNPPAGSVGDTFEARFKLTPDGTRVVYFAVGDTPGMRELHMVSLATPGVATILNAPLQGQGDILDFNLSPDGRHVVYTADQETDFVAEAYLVDLDTPGLATKVNGPVQYGVIFARFTPDGSGITFFADEERAILEHDLYMVSVADPTQRTRLNAALAAGESVVDGYAISADGSRATYTPQSTGSLFKTELMLVELAAPGAALQINGPIPDRILEFGTYGRQDFSPDGKEVVFLTAHRDTSAHRLYFARPSEPGTSIAIGQPLPRDGQFSPVPGFFQFLPADAPKVAPPSGSPPAGGGGGGGSGGGSFGLAGLAGLSSLCFAAAYGRLGPRPWWRLRRRCRDGGAGASYWPG